MTREGGETLSTRQRYEFCNATDADILVSVHTNSVSDQTIDGTLAIYFHSDDKVLATALHDAMYGSLSNVAWEFTDFGVRRDALGVVLKSDMLTAGGVSYGYDANGNQTSRGGDTYTYDHENRLTQSVIGGVTSSSVYNGDGLRMSHTEGVTTTSYTWDVAAGLPVVLQDGTNTYVYGLDLISATDGAGVQTYSLNDGLGSTSDLTDGSANPTDAYSYDVFGTIRSQTGSSSNYWLFTGEQRDGQPGVAGGLQRLPLDVVVSSTNLTGATVANLDDDPDAPDANWATATTVADTSLRAGFPTPPGDPTPGAGLQEFRVLLRKDAAGGNDPTYDIELWETGGGAPLATLVSGATLSSDTGEVVSATWDASLLGTADGSAVELRIVGHRSGGSPNSWRTVEVGAVEWNVDHQGAPGSELYFLRARYYDPEIGRFLGQDALPAANPYAYVGNNPTNLIDPSGLCHKELGYDQICRLVHEMDPKEEQADATPSETYTGGDQADERGEDTKGSNADDDISISGGFGLSGTVQVFSWGGCGEVGLAGDETGLYGYAEGCLGGGGTWPPLRPGASIDAIGHINFGTGVQGTAGSASIHYLCVHTPFFGLGGCGGFSIGDGYISFFGGPGVGIPGVDFMGGGIVTRTVGKLFSW